MYHVIYDDCRVCYKSPVHDLDDRNTHVKCVTSGNDHFAYDTTVRGSGE